MATRYTKKSIENRLSIFAKIYNVMVKLDSDQPDRYNLYKISVKKHEKSEWTEITNYLNSSEMIEFLNSAVRLKEYLNSVETLGALFS